MKFKKIPSDYFITILDRLTRLTPADCRYKRVFDDVVQKFCLNYKEIDNASRVDTAVEIINSSVRSSCEEIENRNIINDYLIDLFINLEKKYFKITDSSYQYLSKRVDFYGLITSLDEKQIMLHKNTVWLKKIIEAVKNFEFKNFSDENFSIIQNLREKEGLLYPVEKIILCEGQTEFTLLNTIFKLFDYDFDKKGCLVIPAGGKNQVARKYYSMIEEYNLPIFILLDYDALQIKKIIDKKLRDKDKIYIIKSGEFEDLIPYNILKNTINNFHKYEFNCNFDDFNKSFPAVKNLELIYRKYGFGEFKKAQFAHELNNYIQNNCSKQDFLNSETEEMVNAF